MELLGLCYRLGCVAFSQLAFVWRNSIKKHNDIARQVLNFWYEMVKYGIEDLTDFVELIFEDK